MINFKKYLSFLIFIIHFNSFLILVAESLIIYHFMFQKFILFFYLKFIDIKNDKFQNRFAKNS